MLLQKILAETKDFNVFCMDHMYTEMKLFFNRTIENTLPRFSLYAQDHVFLCDGKKKGSSQTSFDNKHN